MIGVSVRFLSGRFHGNGWNHAHNEGIPEWPPSPWRLLRALVSAAYSEELPPDEVEPLLEKLRVLPRYRLPRATDAHARYYMPDSTDANHKKTKVFDAFVAVDGGAADPQPLTVAWAVELSVSERALLARLCRRVPYLGRAESWAELEVVDIEGDHWDCWPDERVTGKPTTTLTSLWSAAELESWARDQEKPRKGADVPRRLWDVLTFDGHRYRREGWSSIPGTQLSRYVFAASPFRRAVVPRALRPPSRKPTVARFAIRSAVLPRIEEAISICDRLRTAALSRSEQISGDARDVFSGHSGAPSNHQHAMYLACSEAPKNRARGLIDHLMISARAGFDESDVLALQRLRRLWGRSGHDLELILIGTGTAGDLGGLQDGRSRSLATSRVWESITPFVPTRHPKVVRGQDVDSIPQQIARACEQLLGVRPVEVTPLGEPARWARFRRRRAHGGGSKGPDRGYGARLVFEQPVQGPIGLGFGAHFGLGLFEAVFDG